MKLTELLFIACFLGTVLSFLWILILLIARRWQRAWRCSRRVTIFIGAYLVIVAAVSLTDKQTIYQLGEERCFDDWCVTAMDVKVADRIGNTPAAIGKFVILSLKVSSRAKRVRQSEPHAAVYLLDDHGNRYDTSQAGQEAFESANGKQPAFGVRLAPEESINTVRIFDIPKDTKKIGAAIDHSFGMPPWVHLLQIIGDESSLLHKKTVTTLNLP